MVIALVLAGCSKESIAGPQRAVPQTELVHFPASVDPACHNGKSQLFDHCADQLEIYRSALFRAREEGKVLLVSFGADWCIWCHVFDRYVKGYYNEFSYQYGDEQSSETYSDTLYERPKGDVSAEAGELAEFVARHFVLVHIDYQKAPNGDAVLSENEAWDYFKDSVPFIYSVDANGKFAATFDHDRVQYRRDTRDWYRGYDRVALLAELRELYAAAKTDEAD